MVFSPAHIKRCALTWEAPDYSASYPAGYTNQGVAVIAVAQEHREAQGFCYSALSTVVFISKQVLGLDGQSCVDTNHGFSFG